MCRSRTQVFKAQSPEQSNAWRVACDAVPVITRDQYLTTVAVGPNAIHEYMGLVPK